MRGFVTSAACASVLLAGCEAADGSSDTSTVDQCKKDQGTASAGKTWTLTGNGDREGCKDEKLDTSDLRITVGPIGFAQSESGVLDLSVKPSLPAGVTVSLTEGVVSGSCVSFTVNEDDQRPGGPGLVSYHFDGTIASDGTMNGTFGFTGPGGCRGDGRFVGRSSTR